MIFVRISGKGSLMLRDLEPVAIKNVFSKDVTTESLSRKGGGGRGGFGGGGGESRVCLRWGGEKCVKFD